MFSTPIIGTVKWHVLHVRPRSEKKVGQRLSELGFEVCVPTQKQLRVWSDRKKVIEVVLFTNYVFVATDEKHRNKVFHAGHIFRYVQFSGKIATLSEREMEIVKKLGHLTADVHISYERFALGEEVEIVEGSLSGLRGRITAVNGSSKIQMALPGLQCFANVELKKNEVRRVVRSI